MSDAPQQPAPWMPEPPPGWQPQPPPYGTPPPGSPAGYPPGGNHQQYGYPQYGYPQYGYPRPRDTNGFAIASLVCSLIGIIFLLVGPILGITFGVIGLRQSARLGQGGRGLAIAGIVIGVVVLLLDVLGLVGIATSTSGGGGAGVPA